MWPFVIEDLRKLGAKDLYPKFAGGTASHISWIFLFFVFDMMLLGGAFTSGNVVVVSEHEIDESHTGVRGVFDKLH